MVMFSETSALTTLVAVLLLSFFLFYLYIAHGFLLYSRYAPLPG